MKKKDTKVENNKEGLLYFINNLLCMIASFFYMFYVSITSVALFPVVQQTKELTENVVLETIIKADMFIIRSFMMMFVFSIIFYVVNYLIFKKKNKRILWGLCVVAGLAVVVNFIRVLMFYI